MITGTGNAINYLRPASIYTPANTLTPADAISVPDPVPDQKPGIPVSQLKPLNPGPIIRADQATLDRRASEWLSAKSAASTPIVSDGAPQNTYAEVKVGGKVVATLYNGGSATLTNGAATAIDNLKDPEGLSGPNLAQWRADAYAKALGGTVEKADTAISQSQWKPHTDEEISYTRAQLAQGLAGYFADAQKLVAARNGSWTPPSPSMDFSV
jgi:hypothetical protein